MRRLRIAGTHLAISALVAAASAALVFFVWFPAPSWNIAGGSALFALLISSDLVVGPLLTLIVAGATKPAAELARDVSVIALLQLAAFAYGMYSIAQARPIVVAYEIDRLRIVSAAEIDPDGLADAMPELRTLSWTGPREIAAVKPTTPDGQFRAMTLGMSGIDLSMDPRNWRPYETQSAAAWHSAKPLSKVVDHYPAFASEAQAIARNVGQPISTLRFLPLLSRRASWIAVVKEPGARIVGYLPVDGFF